jgi:hypothetical protein
MEKVSQPLTPTEGIHLMNSLIKDRQLQLDLVDYKNSIVIWDKLNILSGSEKSAEGFGMGS